MHPSTQGTSSELAWPWTDRSKEEDKLSIPCWFDRCRSKVQCKYSRRKYKANTGEGSGVGPTLDPGAGWSVTQGLGRQPTPNTVCSLHPIPSCTAHGRLVGPLPHGKNDPNMRTNVQYYFQKYFVQLATCEELSGRHNRALLCGHRHLKEVRAVILQQLRNQQRPQQQKHCKEPFQFARLCLRRRFNRQGPQAM